MKHSPLVRLTIPMIMGMCGANLFSVSDVRVAFIAACCSVSLLFFFLRKLEKTWQHVAFTVLMSASAFFVGMALFVRHGNQIIDGVPADTTYVFGTLYEKPQQKARSTALKIKQGNGTHIIIYIGKGYLQETREKDSLRIAALNVGDTIVARVAHFNATAATDSTDTPFSYYYRYLFRNGVCATVFTPCGSWECHRRISEASFMERLRVIREKLHVVYESHGIEGDEGGIVEAMTIGRRDSLDKSIRQNYQQSGVAHVLALSGFHVGVIIFVLQWLFLQKTVTFRWRWVSNLLIISALWCYVVIAGSTPSLVRAATMCSIVLVCQSFSHKIISFNSVVLSLTIMLCYNPFLLFDVGFQLSYVAVFGIVIMSGTSIKVIRSRNIVVKYLSGVVLISVVCALATAPVVAYHFGQIPVYGVLTNLLVTLLVTVLMVLAVLWWMLVEWWAAAADVVGSFLLVISHTINATTGWVAALPCATVEWHPSEWGVALCYVLYAIVWLLFHNVKAIRSGK